MMDPFHPQKIYVAVESIGDELTRKILKSAGSIPCEIIPDRHSVQEKFLRGEIKEAEAGASVVLARNSGPFLKPCPGTRYYVCCGYWVLNCYTNCPYGCSYCILPGYIKEPFLTVFTNTENLEQEITEADKEGKILRIGTGELTDSFVLDHITEYSRFLVPLFARSRHLVLELKTKTDHIEHLADLEHGGRTVVAWSVNSKERIAREEPHAASLEARLQAAKKCLGHGYRLAFHFDPLFHFPGWKEEMKRTVDSLFSRIEPSGIAWISLGAFRYPKDLKSIIVRKWGHRPYLAGEFILCRDGKMRYFKPIRIELYAKMIEWIHAYSSDIPIYLCMESREVWNEVSGWAPSSSRDVAAILDASAEKGAPIR
jgi:spore photoproduct lyase